MPHSSIHNGQPVPLTQRVQEPDRVQFSFLQGTWDLVHRSKVRGIRVSMGSAM